MSCSTPPDPQLVELQKKQARFAPVELHVDSSKLEPADQQVLAKLVEAAKVIDELFRNEQVWSGNRALREKLAADTTLVDALRRRLSNISWFMIMLKEPIARLANEEDKVSGHFWAERFGSVRLPNDEALVTTDLPRQALTPIRLAWRVRREDNSFKVIDVIVEGASMAITQRDDYAATVAAIVQLVASLERAHGDGATVGVGIPGSVEPSTGLVKNANSTWLLGQPLQADLEGLLDRPVRIANDANCFALSEATDGAGKEAASVFGVILGTGVGGGIVIRGHVINGPNAAAGEWGHNPLPWPQDDAVEHEQQRDEQRPQGRPNPAHREPKGGD